MSKLNLSWSDRFALIDHYKPTDEQVCATFGLSQDELDTARVMASAGAFRANANFDFSRYPNVFTAPLMTNPTTASSFQKPESASKRPKVPQKRGRKGDKIITAFQAVPTTQVPIDDFIQEHGVSLAVLRQSKRFLGKLDQEMAAKIGKINVRQDKATKRLMIWREV
jgi:hypothetical protein